MNIKGQGHSLTLVQGSSDSTFSNFFSLETAEPIEAKFNVEPAWDEEIKVSTNESCHKIIARLVLRNLILQTRMRKPSSGARCHKL